MAAPAALAQAPGKNAAPAPPQWVATEASPSSTADGAADKAGSWAAADHGLTAVPRILVGHAVMAGRPTGCTVIRVDGQGDPTRAAAVGGVDVRGGAPGTRETELLRPENLVEQVHAVVLAGGSAFGLAAATGTVQFLESQGIGFDVGVAKVPIVPSAILFDLTVGGAPTIRPDASCGERAARAATSEKVAQGNVGAGLGATVGKSRGMAHAMKGGLGSVALRDDTTGLVVAALVVVNAYGDVVDPATGELVAGARDAEGRLIARRRPFPPARTANEAAAKDAAGRNTTLAVVATQARLTKAQATKIAQMAQDGLARALDPAHTPFDGDTVFVMATGDLDRTISAADLTLIGSLAADAVALAVLEGVHMAEGLPGLPASRDLPSPTQAKSQP